LNKDKYELPRFPINEKYGDLERFKFLINLLPIQYKAIIPEEKFLLNTNNPPKLIIEFFNDQPNINRINCFSNEGGEWKNSQLTYKKNKIEVILLFLLGCATFTLFEMFGPIVLAISTLFCTFYYVYSVYIMKTR